ncbi:hypothetical protein [Paraburkholderia sp. BL27I4N3]|nr:hypothetical protein [Paraburkholderia sp. BL27I4N3]
MNHADSRVREEPPHGVRTPWLLRSNLLAYLRDAQADAETEFT